jgi:pSer/pThr/pTyr-binding forkhead associated (FHA) protein
MSSYEEPDWAQEPSSDCQWHLLEAKAGVELAKHALHRACTVLGRAVDMVHIPLQHESASRQHARIAFDSSGTPWLRDLKSTHGTFCNKRKLPPQAVGNVETNSCQTGARGVMLFPGDILQFGASTRIYCVEGPEAFERGAQKLRLSTAPSQPNAVAMRPPPMELETENNKPEDSIVSWGISMDDDISKETATSVDRTVSMDATVPEKHRKMLERLNAHKYKLANLQTEDERIQRKGELSEGQERQLQRNVERETALVESIAELEEELYKKLHPDEAPARHKKTASTAYDDDDIDFYDRTKEQSNSAIDTEGESEKTLTVKWKNFYQQQTQRVKRLEQAQAQELALQERLGRLEAAGDEESFFVQNDLQIAKETVGKIEAEQLDDKNTTMEIERLLKIVNPKLVMDHESGYIGQGPPKKHKDPIREPPASTNNAMMLPPPHIRSEPSSPSNDAASISMPPPSRAVHSPPPRAAPSPPPPHDLHPPPPDVSLSPPQARVVLPRSADGEPRYQPPMESDRVMPPPKRIRVAGPSMPPPAFKGPAARPPPQGTLAMLSAHTHTATNSHDSSAFEKPKSPNHVKKIKDKGLAVADPKKDEWRAPQGQDGSGITKLNAKFAGRY